MELCFFLGGMEWWSRVTARILVLSWGKENGTHMLVSLFHVIGQLICANQRKLQYLIFPHISPVKNVLSQITEVSQSV